MLSVVCPIYNEEKYIAKCIESILSQDYPKDDLEVILVDGMSKDKTKEIVQSFIKDYPFLKILDNPKRIAPSAMNIGICAARGDVIIRLDAHAMYETNYFSVLVTALKKLNADNVGVVCKTDVLNKNPKSLAIREVLSNRFGVGNSVFRTGVDKVMEVDTVPFGCWKRSAFDEYGMYDERLIRNQDFELNRRIIKGGGHIYIIPDSFCTYYARETFQALWKQNYLNGLWGIRTVLFTGATDTLALRHYVPMIFVLSLIVPSLLGFVWWPFALLSALSIAAYVLAIGAVCLGLAIKKGLNFFYLLASFATLHLSNGLGMLQSVFTARSYVKKVNANQ